MRQSSKAGGTKIAQAAKDLNVTSVTIRRYIQEFNIDTAADENGIKVLPQQAMGELHEIRRLKEEGLTNPQVLEFLEERRAHGPKEDPQAEKETVKKAARRPESKSEKPAKKEPRKPARTRRSEEDEDEAAEEEDAAPEAVDEEDATAETESEAGDAEGGSVVELAGDGKSKHSLTCQTCSKVFEHMNPRLRDCLDCYRAKRKERRRGGDKHKNVIAHPIAQQVLNKRGGEPVEGAVMTEPVGDPATSVTVAAPVQRRSAVQRQGVRNYRKAIEDTRHITANLKRRLERPDLPESERRWLEQIYAYQLILHQGWRHLAEYKAGTHPQKPQE